MLPLIFNLASLPVLLAGSGPALARRIEKLHAAGAGDLRVFSPDDVATQHDGELVMERRWPEESEIADASLAMVAGASPDVAARLAGWARSHAVPVNVEDVPELCDFYFTATVTRGDLLIAVSTQGASPTLAKVIRNDIAAQYGPEWESRTEELKQARTAWRRDGKTMAELAALSESWIEEKKWFSAESKKAAS